jgi:hypothetical protein
MKGFFNPAKIMSCLRPALFFIGMAFGFGLCCLAGRWASGQNLFQHFQRFHYYISGDTCFFPTVSEVCRLVESRCPPQKTLVIIGGSSILQSYGADENSLWSAELQKLLGEKYAVINLAMRAGRPADFAWVIARVLSAKYPRMIYISECPIIGVGGIRGTPRYAYFFWDAYYKNLFSRQSLPDETKKEALRVLDKEEEGRGDRIQGCLDSWFYFNDLWTWIGYRYLFTVVSNHPLFFCGFSPRQLAIDTVPYGTRSPDFNITLEKNIQMARQNALFLLKKNPSGEWEEKTDLLKLMTQDWKQAFKVGFNCRILLLQISLDPVYLWYLSGDEQAANDRAVASCLRACRGAGLEAIAIGRDFQPDDYFDLLHLNSAGGNKMAHDVARQILQSPSQ